MATRFEQISADSGFDNSANAWLMVPKGGQTVSSWSMAPV